MTHIERLQRGGVRRRGTPQRGFHYVGVDGKRVAAKEAERIAALKLPPAWKDVYISPSASARLQAMGRDNAGRWQYRYHESFTRRQEARKFERIVDFARALPRLRRRVAADLGRKGLGRERVMACLLRILGTCFIRPGSQQYAEENHSYGLATLRARHVKLKGDTVIFDFPGKSGQHQHRELKDRQVARVVRESLKVKGRDLFKFVLDDGHVVDVRRRHINEYIREVMGERYSAKDFRTWAGTLICACALARAKQRVAQEAGARGVKKSMVEAVREASEHLGNTPAVARASYIYPSVLAMFEKGHVVEHYFESVEELAQQRAPGLHGAEKALLEMLGGCQRPAV
jgi:DNA topoisomerase I